MTAMQTVEGLVARVQRRLFARTLITHVLWFLAGGLLASAAWFVLQQLLLPAAERWIVWSVAAGLVGGALFVAGILSWLARPSRMSSALTLDEQFALKERATTLLALNGDELQSPAGTALLADIEQCVKTLDFAAKLPLQVGWAAAFAPLCGLVLAILAYVSAPSWTFGGNGSVGKDDKNVALSSDAQKKLATLKTMPLQKRELDPEEAEKLKELDDAWKKLIEKPQPKTDEEVRERVREIRTIEEQLKERASDMQQDADKESELKAILNRLDELQPKDKKLSDGPVREFEEALKDGEFDKAEDIIDKLQKKLQNKELDQKQQQDLARQLADLEQKLRKLMDPRDMQNMKELEELAKLLGECKNCLAQELDQEISAAKLRDLLKNLKEMKKLELTKEQMKEMKKGQDDLAEAREALLLTLNRGNGMQGGGPPGGRRPVGDEPKNSKIKDERQTGQLDPGGQLQVSGFSRGGVFSKIPARDVGGAFKQAVQDAPEAIERQQIPPDAADIAKGYFQKLAGEK